jgi:hypothetical protein
MAISPQALESLRALQIGQQAPNSFQNQIAGRQAQESQLDEMKRNLALQQSAPRGQYVSGATTPDIEALQSAMDESPSFGKIAQAQTADTENQYRGAIAQGFRGTDPVREANLYGQKQAEAKIAAPVEAQRVAGQYDVQKQQEASRGALDVAKEQQSGIASRNQAFADLIQGGGAGNLSSFNPATGAMGFRAQQQTPTGIDQDVTNARQKLATAKENVGMFGMTGTGAVRIAEDQLKAAISTALSRHPADASFKAFAQAVAADSKYDNMTLPQILQAAGEDNVSPDEMNQLDSLLRIIRGH